MLSRAFYGSAAYNSKQAAKLTLLFLDLHRCDVTHVGETQAVGTEANIGYRDKYILMTQLRAYKYTCILLITADNKRQKTTRFRPTLSRKEFKYV